MARGFLSGIIWGGAVSVIAAGTVSVIVGGPMGPDATVQAPGSVDAPEASAPNSTTAVADADLVRDGDAPQVASPQADTVAAASAAGEDTPTVPETGAAEDLARPGATADTGAVVIGDVAPVLPVAQADAPAAPGAEAELSISTDPAQPAAPSVPETVTAFAPDDGTAPVPPAVEAPAPAVPDVVEAPAAPAPSDNPAEPDAPAPADETGPGADPDAPVAALPETDATGRPTIGRPAGSLVDRAPDAAEPESTAQDAPPETDTRAILAHATPFENADARPMMAIVLIDSGVDLSGGPVGLAALQSFPYPLSFAVDASLPDATARMADYRARGFEVMALIDLPQGATAGDAEIALSAALDAVPEAVAVMEGTGTGIQDSREAADQIAEAVKATGHGLVLQSKGLNTVQKLAARDGVPAGLIFRDFDSADQTPSVIRRFLDQAAFRAGQEGGVIMVGRVRPDTISALLLWGLQDRAERVALAPISAVLTTLAVPPEE